jgi:anti-anti-sigma regulatory factor
MTNNEVIPDFDDESNPLLSVNIEMLFALTIGAFLALRPSGSLDNTNLSFLKHKIEKIVAAGYYRTIMSLENLEVIRDRSVWNYLLELRKGLKVLGGDIVIVEMSESQKDQLKEAGLLEEFEMQESPRDAVYYYESHHTGNWMEEGLQHAIWYYRQFTYEKTYLPANLHACERIYEIIRKRHFSMEDYRTVEQTILHLLDVPFHNGIQMWFVVNDVDRWLSNSWQDFEYGSLLKKFRTQGYW